jgi:hypothetical protein
MDEIAQKANAARSQRGGDFEVKMEDLLATLLRKGKIKAFERHPSIFNGEFNPDFVVIKNNDQVVSLDATTTGRTDRMRAKQWDAYGTKLFYREKRGKEIRAYAVVQDTDVSTQEMNNFRRCKQRCSLPHSELDGVITIDELLEILTN